MKTPLEKAIDALIIEQNAYGLNSPERRAITHAIKELENLKGYERGILMKTFEDGMDFGKNPVPFDYPASRYVNFTFDGKNEPED
jgi:hypothetical protein